MKKILISFLLFIMIGIINAVVYSMPNPWVDCGDDFDCAKKVSGINFSMRLSNYWVRAMDGMIEISYPFDEIRSVSIRKVEKKPDYDISGVYTKYPINKKTKLKNGVFVDTRGTFRKIYVMNMELKKGYYSAYCEQGMSKREAQGVYENIQESEIQK